MRLPVRPISPIPVGMGRAAAVFFGSAGRSYQGGTECEMSGGDPKPFISHRSLSAE